MPGRILPGSPTIPEALARCLRPSLSLAGWLAPSLEGRRAEPTILSEKRRPHLRSFWAHKERIVLGGPSSRHGCLVPGRL